MNFDGAATEIFQTLRSYDYEVMVFDEDGMKTVEPSKGRRFFAEKQNLLVAINDDGENSEVRLIFPKKTSIGSILGLTERLRLVATRYNMIFTARQSPLANITPKDFATKVSVTEKRNYMDLTEGMYGTSRSSYLRLENARMIVRHSARINENNFGARGRNIDNIFIENRDGERYLFPTTQLAPARAMAHHVSNGGSWDDEGGQAISRSAEDYADLGSMSRHIHLNSGHLDESAKSVRQNVRECMRSMRRAFEGICRKTRYEDTLASLKKPLNEEDMDLTEDIVRLKGLVAREGTRLDDRVYETVCRALREIDMPDATVSELYKTILGIEVPSEVWGDFKNGEIAFLHDPHEPSREMDNTREYLAKAMRVLGAACEQESLRGVFDKIADGLGDATEIAKPKKAFIARALEAVGWDVPKEVQGGEAVVEYANWVDGHTAEKATEDCGHCPEDLMSKKVDEDAESDMMHDAENVKTISDMMTGEHDDDDLTMADVLLPVNQGDSLQDEVDAPVIDDPDTGEEELPTSSYVQRLKSLAGVKNNDSRIWQ